MAETQWIYLFDKANGNALMYASPLEDGEAMPDNATTVECPQGLYDPYFDESSKAWKGLTQEEWEAKHPRKPVEPSADAKVMNTMGIQIANLTKQNQSLSQTVNALGLQIAKMQDTKTTNGGN